MFKSMGRKKKKQIEDENDGLVYSTSSGWFSYEEEEDEENLEDIPPQEQTLVVKLEKNHRGGKTVVIVSGFMGSTSKLNELAAYIKKKCSTGGSVKDGDIIIQGDKRDVVIKILQDLGYKTKRSGA
ncbi:MAG: translation initiation factor [Vicingaceae bacterium]|nr:MAG: translation initiation factor [Vicingaceae bacterium]GIV42601.1 MAG: translation initiation factor [Vicingaceae bacterium]